MDEKRPPGGDGGKRRPIGFWLRRSDELITARVNEAQAVNGLERTEWQVLNQVQESGGASVEQLLEAMRSFVDRPGLERIVAGLRDRGWLAQAAGGSEGSSPLSSRTKAGGSTRPSWLGSKTLDAGSWTA